jgi:hypothetical protein
LLWVWKSHVLGGSWPLICYHSILVVFIYNCKLGCHINMHRRRGKVWTFAKLACISYALNKFDNFWRDTWAKLAIIGNFPKGGKNIITIIGWDGKKKAFELNQCISYS